MFLEIHFCKYCITFKSHGFIPFFFFLHWGTFFQIDVFKNKQAEFYFFQKSSCHSYSLYLYLPCIYVLFFLPFLILVFCRNDARCGFNPFLFFYFESKDFFDFFFNFINFISLNRVRSSVSAISPVTLLDCFYNQIVAL